MRKNKKKIEENNTPENEFELQKPSIEFDDEQGERDYFAEYYNAAKNDYIKQYLDEYHKMKAQEEYDRKRQ